jgi:hypothetical protein
MMTRHAHEPPETGFLSASWRQATVFATSVDASARAGEDQIMPSRSAEVDRPGPNGRTKTL